MNIVYIQQNRSLVASAVYIALHICDQNHTKVAAG